MDFSKLRTGELVAGICGALLFIDMFFPWFGIGGAIGNFAAAAGVDTNANAWDALDLIRFILLLTAFAGIGSALLGASGRSVALPVAASVIVTVVGIIASLLVLYRIIDQPGPNDVVTVQFGAYLGFLLCLGIAAGGFMAMSDEGTSLGDAARRAQGGGTPSRPVPPAAPPPPPAAPPSAGDPPPPPPSGGPPPPA
jgi:hypothetical protein